MAKTPDLIVNVAEGVVIRPGDKVLVTLPLWTSPERVADLRSRWDELMPEVQVVFLAGAESVVVQRAS